MITSKYKLDLYANMKLSVHTRLTGGYYCEKIFTLIMESTEVQTLGANIWAWTRYFF